MKNEKPKLDAKKQSITVDEQLAVKSAALKKKKKIKQDDKAPKAAASKVNKIKSEKADKKIVEPKDIKAPKDDKMTKFLVSMKKSVRKSIKKEAAEIGVSMNEFIVQAAEEKLRQG